MRNEYHLDRMMLYGPCHLCGGPRTACWDVDAPDGPASMTVTMASMCLMCGYGDPSYRPEVDA